MASRNDDGPTGPDRNLPRPRAGTSAGARPFRARLVRIVSNAATFYLAIVGLLMFFENKLVFFPSKHPEGDWSPPGLTFEDAWFTADDGTKLHGWYVPNAKPTAHILFCHGNAGNITHRADLLRKLNGRCGAAVLLFDYRGYGRSEGTPSETGVLADARAARAWLAAKAGISESEVVLMGESLGGAVAVDLATDGARGLILENTFTSVPDVAAHHYPWVPIRLLMRTQLNAREKIGQYHGPLLQTHGEADTIVPYALGRALFDAANGPKRFYPVPGGDHNDLRTPGWYAEIRKFLAEL